MENTKWISTSDPRFKRVSARKNIEWVLEPLDGFDGSFRVNIPRFARELRRIGLFKVSVEGVHAARNDDELDLRISSSKLNPTVVREDALVESVIPIIRQASARFEINVPLIRSKILNEGNELNGTEMAAGLDAAIKSALTEAALQKNLIKPFLFPKFSDDKISDGTVKGMAIALKGWLTYEALVRGWHVIGDPSEIIEYAKFIAAENLFALGAGNVALLLTKENAPSVFGQQISFVNPFLPIDKVLLARARQSYAKPLVQFEASL